MRGTSKRTLRGFVLPYVLGFSAVLALLAMTLLTSAQSASRSTYSIQEKNGAFDAAEAGLNAALDDLDKSLLAPTSRAASMPNGYGYSYRVFPNFTSGVSQSITDPVNGAGQIFVPIGGAIIVSTGYGPNGARPTTVEAAVCIDTTQLTFPQMALVAGLNIQGNYDPAAGIGDPNGTKSATIHANGNITAKVRGGVQGRSAASGAVNTLPPGTTNAPAVPLPTISQFDYMVASYRSQAIAFGGPNNQFAAAGTSLPASYTCSIAGSLTGCLLFYDGPLSVSPQGVTFYGPWTMVVNGDLSESGQASVTMSGRPALIVVNGNASISGNATLTGYVQVKGSTNLGGNGLFTGALMSLGSLTLQGGGSSGGFVYDPSVIPPSHAITGLVKIVTYAEY